MRISWSAETPYEAVMDIHALSIEIKIMRPNIVDESYSMNYRRTFSTVTTDITVVPDDYYLIINTGKRIIGGITITVWDYY